LATEKVKNGLKIVKTQEVEKLLDPLDLDDLRGIGQTLQISQID